MLNEYHAILYLLFQMAKCSILSRIAKTTPTSTTAWNKKYEISQNLMSLTLKTKNDALTICPPEGLENIPFTSYLQLCKIVFGSSYFCFTFSHERKSERIKRKFKTQNLCQRCTWFGERATLGNFAKCGPIKRRTAQSLWKNETYCQITLTRY